MLVIAQSATDTINTGTTSAIAGGLIVGIAALGIFMAFHVIKGIKRFLTAGTQTTSSGKPYDGPWIDAKTGESISSMELGNRTAAYGRGREGRDYRADTINGTFEKNRSKY